MIKPLVSIIVLNWSHPEAHSPNIIASLLEGLPRTRTIPYETVIVDNASPNPQSIETLCEYKKRGIITTLVLLSENKYFCGGVNVGFRNTDSRSEYVLLLSSDIEILNPFWLLKLVQWLDGYFTGITYDIVSVGWSADANIQPTVARPEGWCCAIRHSIFEELDTEFVHCNGLEKMIALLIRQGARCGILGNYNEYLKHYGGGSESWRNQADISSKTTQQPNFASWFHGLHIETLDFKLDEQAKHRICNNPDWKFADDESYNTRKGW